jgi:hypothetical protein
MSTASRTALLRASIPVVILLCPLILGYPLLLVFRSRVIFYASAAVPQYLIWPYLSYYNSEHNRPFEPFEIPATVAHWSLVLAL